MNNQEKIEKALSAIKSAYGTEDDEYGGTLFISHHLEELSPEYWKKHTGKETPNAEEIFNLFELQEAWEDGCTFDFTLPEEVTDYVVSVSFDENGKVEDIVMES